MKISNFRFKISNNSGQVMIITIVMMGGILLSATAIAGLLLVYQIRQANDSENSAKAFFASDTGLEITSWCYFKGCSPHDAINPPLSESVFGGGSDISYKIESILTTSTLNIVSKGYAANEKIIRILEAEFEK